MSKGIFHSIRYIHNIDENSIGRTGGCCERNGTLGFFNYKVYLINHTSFFPNPGSWVVTLYSSNIPGDWTSGRTKTHMYEQNEYYLSTTGKCGKWGRMATPHTIHLWSMTKIIQWDNFMRHHAHRIQSLTPSPSHPLPSRLRHASRSSYTCMEGRAVLMG